LAWVHVCVRRSARTAHGMAPQHLAEYFLDENHVPGRKESTAEFGDDVNRLRDDVERTAKRIEKLEQKLRAAQGTVTTGSAGKPPVDH